MISSLQLVLFHYSKVAIDMIWLFGLMRKIGKVFWIFAWKSVTSCAIFCQMFMEIHSMNKSYSFFFFSLLSQCFLFLYIYYVTQYNNHCHITNENNWRKKCFVIHLHPTFLSFFDPLFLVFYSNYNKGTEKKKKKAKWMTWMYRDKGVPIWIILYDPFYDQQRETSSCLFHGLSLK